MYENLKKVFVQHFLNFLYFYFFRSDINTFGAWPTSESLSTFRPESKTSLVQPKMLQDPTQIDPDSDPEDDPGKLLNVWLGELDNLKKVSK